MAKNNDIFSIDFTNIVVLLLILAVIFFLYNRYIEKMEGGKEMNDKNSNSIQKYLLGDSSLADVKKPILWIPINYDYNSRNWISFGSRSSFELNQPYLYLTVKSIINQCGNSFHICIIDDKSFAKLLPEWNIDMNIISNPIKMNMRKLGWMKLIYMYGGIFVPPSFLCMRDLIDIYNTGTENNKLMVCENVDHNITSTTYNFYPDTDFLGATKNSEIVNNLIDFMQRTISSDYTHESVFLGEFDRWCNARKNQVNIIDGKLVGIKTIDDTAILIDDLMSNSYIDIYSKTYGIWIPEKQILKRNKYQWFARLSPRQVLESKIIISKYILLASTPDSVKGVIEEFTEYPEWIGYWQVPSGFGLWGQKPNYLGNNLIIKDPDYSKDLV